MPLSDHTFFPSPVLKIKRLHPDAVMPRYATAGAACFDLHAIDTATVHAQDPWGHDVPGAKLRTGLAVEVPEGYVLLIYSRSGHGFNHDVRLANSVGVIDSDYRGEIQVKLTCDVAKPFYTGNHFRVNKLDRIAQAMLVAAPRVTLVETDTLTETERGEGGFGSTGAQ